ncbi:hypothetical protein A4G20_00005 [Pasteurellaceae bacterium RH1A]|nr:hypothetical protein A4G20_00005 [Pasteurellaceae bacterium RH1A]
MKKIIAIMGLGILLSACAGQEKLEKETAFALGVDPEQVKVSNIDRGMYETKYNAVINGRKHNCTVIGGNPVSFGVVVSPTCVEVTGSTKATGSTKKTKGSCNIMLEKAGKCSR